MANSKGAVGMGAQRERERERERGAGVGVGAERAVEWGEMGVGVETER